MSDVCPVRTSEMLKKTVVIQVLAVIVDADSYVGMHIVGSASEGERWSLDRDNHGSKHDWRY